MANVFLIRSSVSKGGAHETWHKLVTQPHTHTIVFNKAFMLYTPDSNYVSHYPRKCEMLQQPLIQWAQLVTGPMSFKCIMKFV